MKLFVVTLLLFFANLAYAGCDDQPSNEVDWTNCNFVENLDLIGVGCLLYTSPSPRDS